MRILTEEVEHLLLGLVGEQQAQVADQKRGQLVEIGQVLALATTSESQRNEFVFTEQKPGLQKGHCDLLALSFRQTYAPKTNQRLNFGFSIFSDFCGFFFLLEDFLHLFEPKRLYEYIIR